MFSPAGRYDSYFGSAYLVSLTALVRFDNQNGPKKLIPTAMKVRVSTKDADTNRVFFKHILERLT